MSTINDKIKKLSQNLFEKIKQIRRHIHANPELSFQEYNTSKYVSKILEEEGIEHKTGIAETGIVGHIKGKAPDSQLIALRADMDALPILEENDVEYKSKNEGCMHACGHDVHTSCLLGAAMIINELKDDLKGTVRLIFQPGEERIPGGAGLMIEEGVLKYPVPDAIFGQHVYPELEAGEVGLKPGKYMASADEIQLIVKGKGGHAAMPDKLTDPVLIASNIITGLQQVISRNANPETPSVLSFGSFQANGSTNVIPNNVEIEGTFRTFDEEWRDKAHEKINSIAKHTAR
ncbi:MAG: M20 family metallopeptidase, partial [Flavobacteriales bacterium]